MENYRTTEHNFGGYGNYISWDEAFNRELADTAMRFVDRARYYCKEDPAEKVCDEFKKAMSDVMDRFGAMIGTPSEKYDMSGNLKEN